MNNVKISIIVPVYNVEKYIAQCIESILNQIFKDFEVLCIDDCGTDNSVKIIEEYAKKDRRIKIIKHEFNKGLGTARNTGVEHSKGKYIACVDSDDWILPDYLKLMYEKIEETGVNSVWCKPWSYLDWNQKTEEITFPALVALKEGFTDVSKDNIHTFPAYAWNKMYRKDFITKNNLRWADGLIFEDIEFYYRFFTKSTLIYMLDEHLYMYRRRMDSIVSSGLKAQNNFTDIITITKRLYDYLLENKLFPKYSHAFTVQLISNVKLYLNSDACRKQVLEAANKMFKEIDLELLKV
ncbi:glycosyltransferase family 2 protein [bacterium]|nr:glycosyltransferase family 2 protein [bacterium]